MADDKRPAPSTGMNAPDGGQVGVDFIDILFGLVVGEIFMQLVTLTAKEKVAWANFLLALTLVSFSWIGYHKSKKASPKDLRFDDLTWLSFFIDVATVGSYYLLVTQDKNARSLMMRNGVHLHPQELTLVAVFGLYAIWDLIEVRLAASGQKSAPLRHLGVSAGFTVVIGLISLVGDITDPRTNKSIIVLTVVYGVALYIYRRAQESFASV